MSRWVTSLWLEFLYFSGCARVVEFWRHRHGVILRFERVRRRGPGRFRPLRAREITPELLDRIVRALRRWKYDIVSIDQVPARLQQSLVKPRRFVCLTFDIGYRDFLQNAWPVLKKHEAPVTLYIPGRFPDQLGELWWLALEDVVARNDRIGLIVRGAEQRLTCRTVAEKRQAFAFLYDVIDAMAPADCSNTIRDLCGRYGVDLAAVSAAAILNWSEIASIATDPLLTIGSASLTYPALSKLEGQSSERELRMGRAVVESAIGRSAPHLAYPYGSARKVGPREIVLASGLGFATAVTTQADIIRAKGNVDMLALPRISFDGRRSLRALRVMLAGLGLKRVFGPGALRREIPSRSKPEGPTSS